MIQIPEYAKNVRVNIVKDKNNCIKEIHYEYEVDEEKIDKMFASKIDNTPSIDADNN